MSCANLVSIHIQAVNEKREKECSYVISWCIKKKLIVYISHVDLSVPLN